MTFRMPILCALTLGLCLAMSSIVSATMMAPDRASSALEIYELTYGALPEDFCGDSHAGHDHHCPFCHALPGTAPVVFAPLARAFIPQDDWSAKEALQRAAQGRNVGHSTRAPPQFT